MVLLCVGVPVVTGPLTVKSAILGVPRSPGVLDDRPSRGEGQREIETGRESRQHPDVALGQRERKILGSKRGRGEGRKRIEVLVAQSFRVENVQAIVPRRALLQATLQRELITRLSEPEIDSPPPSNVSDPACRVPAAFGVPGARNPPRCSVTGPEILPLPWSVPFD